MIKLITTLILIALCGANALGSVLSDTVNAMTAGTWAVVPGISGKSVLSTTLPTAYGDSGCWDPVNNKWMMIGSDHIAPYVFPIYSASNNSWTAGPQLPGIPFSTTLVGHAFDGNTSDLLGNCYYRIRRGTGGGNVDIYKYNVASNVWTALPVNPLVTSGEYTQCCQGIAYFPEIGGLIWVTQARKIYLYQSSTNAWSQVSTTGHAFDAGGGTNNFVEYNPVLHVALIGSGNDDSLFKLTATGTGTGTLARMNNAPAGVLYSGTGFVGIITVDPVGGTFIVLEADDRVCRTYNISTDTWGTCTNPPTTPALLRSTSGAPLTNLGAIGFLSCGSTSGTCIGDMYVYKHATMSADQDFSARCNAPGVVRCVGFDSASEVPQNVLTGGIWASTEGTFPTLDTAIKVSGASSLKITMPANEGSNAGGWYQSFLGSGINFGPGSRFYVQYRYRMSPGMLTPSNGGGGNKMSIIYSQEGGTCANAEITTNNGFWRGYPQMYTACGAGAPLYDNLGNGDFLIQNGKEDPRFECHYQSPVERSPYPCGFYHTNEWTTFYYDITIGNPWGSATSVIRGYYQYDGQAMRQFQFKNNYVINQGSAINGFNRIVLLGYDTDRTSHPTTNTVWYDELIISTQPIAAVGGGTPDTTAPAAPTGVTVR